MNGGRAGGDARGSFGAPGARPGVVRGPRAWFRAAAPGRSAPRPWCAEDTSPTEGGKPGASLLEVHGVDFSYGRLQILFDVSLDVREGETLALLGTNGAGKSTLLKVISGLRAPSRGDVRFGGTTITTASPGDRIRAGMALVPGGRATFPSLSVGENLLAGGYTFIRDGPRLRQRVEQVVELFPILGQRIEQDAGTLSGGEQQMLGLAMGLMLEPRLLLIDELSLGLAPVIVQQLLAVLDALKAGGTTIVIVEQSVNVALAVADRAVFMEKGEIRFSGPAHELAQRDDLVRAVFLGVEGG